MNKPAAISYTAAQIGRTVTAKQPRDIAAVNGQRCLDGGHGKLPNGKSTHFWVGIDNKPELKAQVDAWLAEWAAYDAFKTAEFAANVPGYTALRAAQAAVYNERCRYGQQFEAMMSDEHNDGARPPKPENMSLAQTAQALATQYPRAAAYIQAEGYTQSNNVDKYSAGKRAMELIATGGTLEDAAAILENWLPESGWNN